MDFNLLTNKEIANELANRFEQLRLTKQLSEKDISNSGGVTKDAIYRFKSNKNISLDNFIKILRGVDELKSLEKIFHLDNQYSPKENSIKKLPKKIFKTKNKNGKNNTFKWGDEE